MELSTLPLQQERSVVRTLAALAQAQRLRSFRALVEAGATGCTPGHLCVALGIAPSALSFHLKALVHAGLVHSEPQGRHLIYRASLAQMGDLMDYLNLHCCGHDACGD